jgi:hypothetical protein
MGGQGIKEKLIAAAATPPGSLSLIYAASWTFHTALFRVNNCLFFSSACLSPDPFF